MDATALGEALRPSRRRVLAVLGLGGTAAMLPAGAAPVRAAATPAAVKRPTNDDVVLLDFALSAELAIVGGYDRYLATASGATDDVAVVVREHHEAYANALSGLLGSAGTGVANPKLAEELAEGAWDDAFLAAVETIAFQTHLSLVGALVGTDGAMLTASIAAGESRHAAAYQIRSGSTDALFPDGGVDVPVVALDPAEYSE